MSQSSQEPLQPEILEDYDPAAPIAPQDVASAARGCQAIVMIFAFLALFGCLALFVAVFNSNGRGELIQLLRSRGANPNHANASGQTPVGLAKLIANHDVVKFFSDVTE